MKYYDDLDLVGAHELLNFIVHNILTSEENSTLQLDGSLAYNSEAKKLVVRNPDGVQQVAYVSDILNSAGKQVYYSEVDPETIVPEVVLVQGDQWFQPSANELRIRTDVETWQLVNNAQAALVPDSIIGNTVVPSGIVVNPADASLWQNRTLSDIVLTGVAGNGNAQTIIESEEDGLTRISGVDTRSVKVVLDYNSVGTGVAVGNWGYHPDYPSDTNWGYYDFEPVSGGLINYRVNVERNGTSPTSPNSVKFHVEHKLKGILSNIEVFTGDYDEEDLTVGSPRDKVYPDISMVTENIGAATGSFVTISFKNFESVDTEKYMVVFVGDIVSAILEGLDFSITPKEVTSDRSINSDDSSKGLWFFGIGSILNLEITQNCISVGQKVEVHVGDTDGFQWFNNDTANIEIIGSGSGGSTTQYDTVILYRMDDESFGITGKQVYKAILQ